MASPPLPTQYPPRPEWVEDVRPHQVDAINEALEHFNSGTPVVFMDAPTGSGKTLIGDEIARTLNGRALYVCSDKSLQDQVARDFEYGAVLKGRANYPTQSDPRATAADCTAQGPEDPCWFCRDGKPACPYEIAKREAMLSPLAITNTAYMLAEANYVGGMSGRDLCIADEADTLESILMGFVEVTIPIRYMDMVKMSPPKKGARKTTMIAWLQEFVDLFVPLVRAENDMRRKRAMQSTASAALRMIPELQKDIDRRDADSEDNGVWLRDYDYRLDKDGVTTFTLKPVKVDSYGFRNLWRHARRWLVMSATIISADEMADSLGLPLDYATVTVPSTFPVENRPIILAPVANVIRSEMDDAVQDLAYAIGEIARKYAKTESILVHTVSYDLTKRLQEELKMGPWKVQGRDIITYSEGRMREDALTRFKQRKGSVLLAPSMERGIDLPDDLCRVQIIAKVPFPYLGDRQVSARMRLPGGQTWYAVKAIRDVVQMAGRGVRHRDDWADTYILDQQFPRNLYRQWKPLFPTWFMEAVDSKADVRWLMRPR